MSAGRSSVPHAWTDAMSLHTTIQLSEVSDGLDAPPEPNRHTFSKRNKPRLHTRGDQALQRTRVEHSANDVLMATRSQSDCMINNILSSSETGEGSTVEVQTTKQVGETNLDTPKCNELRLKDARRVQQPQANIVL